MSDTMERRPSLTKIVATVGPASRSPEMLRSLVDVGVDVFRLNAAHGKVDDLARDLAAIRGVSRDTGRPVAVLVDLAGPKMRLGELPGGSVLCCAGQQLRFVRGTVSSEPGTLTTTYEPLIDELRVGNRVLLADGTVSLIVESVTRDAATCRVVQAGTVRSRQGVNLPGVKLSVASLGEQDVEVARWAAKAGIDFLGLSFVRAASDITGLRDLLRVAGGDAHIVAKIEKPEAVEDLDAIIGATDAVMVARGDLGVEIPIAEVPVVQKRIIAACNRRRKPVIVATQMLESMQHSRLPTRAEATDVANAILDGADACMLSGETAVGEYPREAVETMHAIAMATEPIMRERRRGEDAAPARDPGDNIITEATVEAAGRIACGVEARLIVVATASGSTARSLSRHRFFVHTIGVSDSEVTLRRMCLYWGVFPVAAPPGGTEELLRQLVDRAKTAGYLSPGDRVVLIGGTGLRASRHNTVLVHQIET